MQDPITKTSHETLLKIKGKVGFFECIVCALVHYDILTFRFDQLLFLVTTLIQFCFIVSMLSTCSEFNEMLI